MEYLRAGASQGLEIADMRKVKIINDVDVVGKDGKSICCPLAYVEAKSKGFVLGCHSDCAWFNIKDDMDGIKCAWCGYKLIGEIIK